MTISSLQTSPILKSVANEASEKKITPAEAQKSFGELLKNAINEVNRTQNTADGLKTDLALGKNVQLHDVMIASQKASITLNLAMEVRNKAVEAYQEIMRMQI